MKQWEYEALQAALTKKSENNPYGRTGNFKREDGYKEGILAGNFLCCQGLCPSWRRLDQEES